MHASRVVGLRLEGNLVINTITIIIISIFKKLPNFILLCRLSLFLVFYASGPTIGGESHYAFRSSVRTSVNTYIAS